MMLSVAVEIGAHAHIYFLTIAVIAKMCSFSVEDLVSLQLLTFILRDFEILIISKTNWTFGANRTLLELWCLNFVAKKAHLD